MYGAAIQGQAGGAKEAAARLRSGFTCLDPSRIPPDKIGRAASLSGSRPWAYAVRLEDLPQMDAIVCGSVAVTRDGHRCGKGEGYSDLEYGILRELGHRPVPVATTVHPVQIVDAFPSDPNDLPLSVIVTPDDVLRVKRPPPAPGGIDWDRLSEADLTAMPVLKDLRDLRRCSRANSDASPAKPPLLFYTYIPLC